MTSKFINLLRKSRNTYIYSKGFTFSRFYYICNSNLLIQDWNKLVRPEPNYRSFAITGKDWIRAMSSDSVKSIDIKDYVKMRENPDIMIIDVREKSEIAETGILPGAINIPVGEIADALQKSPENFQKLYNKSKPSVTDQIIFSCRSGKRSMMAAQAAQKLGFMNALNLTGGWLAWEEYSSKEKLT